MAEPQMVDPHDVVMTGENSFIRLSNDGGSTMADRVSHWRVLWSPAGQGHALFIESALAGGKPEELSALIRSEYELWSRVVKAGGVKLE